MPGVYVSFPFCAQKCTFCNFASGVFPAALELEYLTALQEEIASTDWPWTPETVYLGGGTPSQMDTAVLADILRLIPGRPWREATIEAAPGTLTADRVRSWREAGINRVSLGVQSLITRELAKTGRKHTAATVESDCALLRVHGIENINIDLIAGLPFQSLESWRESLASVQKLDVPHVSVYMLEVDEDSRLGAQILVSGSRYGAAEVPSDESVAEFYRVAVAKLGSFGISRYEISNFAKPGCESLHNLKYWKLQPYLGFGADAHSFSGGQRWGNVESAAEYVDRWRARVKLPNEPKEPSSGEEKFFLGLRLAEGMEPSPEDWVRFVEPIERFISYGLLERNGSMLRLTPEGVLLSNEVFQEFLEA